MAIDASAVEATMPSAGTWRFETRPNAAGKSPSLAAARGISAQIIVHPLRAPMPEMITAMATLSPAHEPLPTMVFAATEYDARLASWARAVAGTMPNTAMSDSM